MSVTYHGSGNPDGDCFGQSGEKVAFYGATPIAQRTGASQAALTITMVQTSGFGFSTTTQAAAFVAQVEEMRATLAALGLFKGGA